MDGGKRFGWVGFAAVVAAVTVLVAGGAAAIGADPGKTRSLTAGAAAKGLTKKQVLKLIRGARRGRRGPQGVPGPPGAPGPQGPQGPPAPGDTIAKKLSFKANAGSPLQVPYEAHGMKLEAECTAAFTLRFRSLIDDAIVHAGAVGDGGASYSGGYLETGQNSSLDLVPAGEPLVTGKVEYTAPGGRNMTINYMAAYGTAQGDCVFTGTIVEA